MAKRIFILVILIIQIANISSSIKGCINNGTVFSCIGSNLTSDDLPSIFGNLPPNLTTLIFDENNITNINLMGETSKNFFNLTKISLRLNKITKFPENLQSIFPNLEVLELSGNHIESLDLIKIPTLRELYLDSNRLEYLTNNTFAHLNGLSILSLERNDIQFITANAFYNLTSLKYISLAGNKIADLHSGLFDSFRTNDGIIVNLSSNIIQSIPYNLFTFESVRNIDLSGNEIWNIKNDAFLELIAVDGSINLENNILKMVPLFPELPSGIIKLEGNPLICNCDLFARTKAQGEITFNGTCQHPEEERGRNINDVKSNICTYCDLHKPCQNKGHCIDYPGNFFYKCICEKPYYGQRCEEFDHDWRNCTNITCPVHSECIEIRAYNYECQCVDGFKGNPCVPVHTDENSRMSFYITIGLAMLGGIVLIFCFVCCCMKRYRKHESYMVVPSERTNIGEAEDSKYGGL
uniref:EGF-like domain-containing protein n=1 Tax=Clytia hemisphaerica TaxID=252671 RepID=A0A7M5WID8_9CNID|eukprot:TCONS_00034863-protein